MFLTKIIIVLILLLVVFVIFRKVSSEHIENNIENEHEEHSGELKEAIKDDETIKDKEVTVTDLKETLIEDEKNLNKKDVKKPLIKETAKVKNSMLLNETLQELVVKYEKAKTIANKQSALKLVISESYKQRDILTSATVATELADNYLTNLPKIIRAQKKANPTKEIKEITLVQLITILTEQKMFTKAIEACDLGISLKLVDGTIGGFAGRKSRIEKQLI